MTIPHAAFHNSADSSTRRARRDLLALVLIVVGAVGFDLCMWMVNPWVGAAVLALYVAGVGVAVGLDREGART